MSDLVLKPEEVHTLTAKVHRKNQEAWLIAHGVPYRRDGRRILVAREAAAAWLLGQKAPATGRAPDFSGAW